MPLIAAPRALLGLGRGGRGAPRNLFRTIVLMSVMVIGVIAVGVRLGETAIHSGSGLAGGILVFAIGFVVAIVYGIARDTSIGLLAWLVAMAFGRLVPGHGLFAVDRLAFMIFAGAWFIEVVNGRRELGRFGMTEFLMVCFVMLAIASSLLPHDLPVAGEKGAHRSLFDLILSSAFLPFAGFVLARQTLLDERNVKRFLWALAIFGTYLAITNILWLTGPKNLVWPHDIFDPSVGAQVDRARGVFLNAAVTGYALIACFVAAMHLARANRRWRLPLVVVSLMMIVGIGLTQTRSAWLAAAFVVVFSAIVNRGFRRWYIVILIGVGLLVGAKWSDFTSSDRAKGGVTSVNETQDRLNAFATGVWAIEQKPIFGWGLGTFPSINSVHHKAWKDTPWNRGYGIFPHDTQVGTGAELGLVGLGLWLMIIISMIIASGRAWRALPRSGLLSRGLASSFWCIAIAWAVTASLIDIRLFAFANTVFFLFGGMCAGLADKATREADEASAETRIVSSGPHALTLART
jgi:O-antigen ligase